MYQPYQSTWVNPYAQPYQQPYPQPQPYQQPVNGIIKVNGRDSALQYQLPPNSTSPALFDASGKCFFVVSTDGTGTKSIECFDFSPHVEETHQIQAGFVSRDEFDALVEKVREMEARNGSDGSVQKRASKQPASDTRNE